MAHSVRNRTNKIRDPLIQYWLQLYGLPNEGAPGTLAGLAKIMDRPTKRGQLHRLEWWEAGPMQFTSFRAWLNDADVVLRAPAEWHPVILKVFEEQGEFCPVPPPWVLQRMLFPTAKAFKRGSPLYRIEHIGQLSAYLNGWRLRVPEIYLAAEALRTLFEFQQFVLWISGIDTIALPALDGVSTERHMRLLRRMQKDVMLVGHSEITRVLGASTFESLQNYANLPPHQMWSTTRLPVMFSPQDP